MVLALSLPVSITDLVTASLLTVSLRFFSFSLLGFGGGGGSQEEATLRPGWSPTPGCSSLPSLSLSLAPSLFPVTKRVFFCLLQESPACPQVLGFLLSALRSFVKEQLLPQ